ncbi:uncharacterized protein LOC100876028 [Megachile rotundata]|uniref:uncharacterized protein LOC100876028 n=1 Tax=Megachile rotundata TaxID=143995 RepID=UPI00061506F2|nr:PREDICTED: uncharacterized protein LOC100876028 [Megachile rotundata]
MCVENQELNCLIKKLQTCSEDTVILRELINFASSHKKSWNDENLKQLQPALTYILEIFIINTETGRDRVLLASHTFFALLSMQPTLINVKNNISNFLQHELNELCFYYKKYNIAEPNLFKLTCAYGYLQVNRKEMYSNDVCLLIFDNVFEHCIKYTKYSYFAYKILYMWLQRTMNTNFWDTCDLLLEQKLEAIIFSNWCNAINEISKQNSTLIFKMYLKIMKKKYDGYLEFLFRHCVDKISWQNEIKYDIITEVCEISDNTKVMISHNFLLSLCTSLTKYYLRSGGTKVYLAIVKKLNENEWKEAFGDVMNYLFHNWESTETENYNALQLLCKHWLEPVIKMHGNILKYLWSLIEDIKGHFLRSHFQRMANEMHIDLPQQAKIECYINHKNEVVRLNGFAISCYQVINFYNEYNDQFFTIRSFLWYNANSTSVCMRDGIIKYFQIFYANIIKMYDNNPESINDVHYIIHWLHEFLLDCFEIGSCYQRKIVGLNLYRVILSYTNIHTVTKFKNIENTSYIALVEKHLKMTKDWNFINRKSLFALLRLVLDSAFDIKQLATSVILDYFDKDILLDMEKQMLYHIALKHCNSSKFYEIESGAALIKILATWFPLNSLLDKTEYKNCNNIVYLQYSDFLFTEASSQLIQMKEDMLKAIIQNKPFYGVLSALLSIVFQNGPENICLTLEFIEKILFLLEDATDFFLSVISSKSENKEYSSSFAEMGLAIDEIIKNSEVDNINYDELNLSPAHQVLISCIWMSLKVSCEIACEIGSLMYSDEIVKRSTNIIVAVLLRCRHKGVVEAAGTAVGQLTRCLCKENKYSDLLKTHILRILENDTTIHSLNITRRGAGLSIMFHRIVVGDNRRDRPLLHFAVQKLLDLLDNTSDDFIIHLEFQHDSPVARHLHFLRALVANKEIHAQLTPYMERISLTCFKYLESETWTIRNASLQLFGAIVPRLVGQSYGDTLDFGNGYSINHFITHYPVLTDYITKELQRFSKEFFKFSTALYSHSSIVHILILLSKFSNSGCQLIDYPAQYFIFKTKRLLHILFQNPVLYVRRLAAKAYAALTEHLEIALEIEKLRCTLSLYPNVNVIHGHLLTIQYLKEKLATEIECLNSCSNVIQCTDNKLKPRIELLRFRRILQIWNNLSKEESNSQICYVLETLFLQLKESNFDEMFTTDVFTFNENMSVFGSEKVKPGFFQFIDVSTKLYAEYLNRTNKINNDTVHKILNSHCVDQTISFLNHVSPSIPILQIVFKHLLNMNEHDCNELLLNVMVNYALKTLRRWPSLDTNELNIEKTLEKMFVETKEIVTNSRLWNLKCIITILFSKNEALIAKILLCALNLCIHEEEHMRNIAVELVQYSVYRFTDLTNKNKLTILQCCLILLKDEIFEIRKAIAESLRTHVLQKMNVEFSNLEHDECIYQKLLSEVMCSELTSKDMNLLFVKLFTRDIKNFNVNATVENPFCHDDNPSYKEETKFLNFCFYYTQQKKYRHSRCSTICNRMESDDENIINVLTKAEIKHQLQNKYFDDTNLEIVLNTKYVDYLLRKQELVIQECS